MSGIAEQACPGQFVEVGTGGATLLNKPISIAAIDRTAGTFSLVYKVVGSGTHAIASFKPGMDVKVLGPCGNGFGTIESGACLVGGGIGIPPMHFLAQEHQAAAGFSVILGAGTADDIVLKEEFTQVLGAEPYIATDDGTAGHHGTTVDLLDSLFKTDPVPVYACGPVAMLSSIAERCRQADVPSYVCLEAYMGCGIGICVGCVIPTVRGMERVCAEGPVFSGSDVLWSEF
jgi:dihydroorotate dehydrogenase electron transfer subunit